MYVVLMGSSNVGVSEERKWHVFETDFHVIGTFADEAAAKEHIGKLESSEARPDESYYWCLPVIEI